MKSSVHRAYLKQNRPREQPLAPEFDQLDEYFPGDKLPLPGVDRPGAMKVKFTSLAE